MIQIIPAVLATSEADYENDIKKLSEAPTLEGGWVHIDFMDDIFVPNQSIKADAVGKFPIDLKKEAHLMVKEVQNWIESAEEVKFDRVLLHYEAAEEQKIKESLASLAKKGIEAGLAVNPQTEIEKIKPFLQAVQVILVMGVEPGFQGRPFVEETYERVKQVVKLREEAKLSFKIAVDGGVNDKNARKLVDSGVDYLIVGSFLIKNNIEENLEKLWEVINL